MKLNPWFVTGFTDAEGCFTFSISRKLGSQLGWTINLVFEISAFNNPANREFLELLPVFFGGGKIYLSGSQLYFKVRDLAT
jgi:hypothetical protein